MGEIARSNNISQSTISGLNMLKIGDNWKCSFCGHAQVICDERYHHESNEISVDGWLNGAPILVFEAIVCANNDCLKLTLEVSLATRKDISRGKPYSVSMPTTTIHNKWSLLPQSSAKPLPDYIPDVLRRDYEEACRIRDLSPKASATIIRRCLQGMIRDFCGIVKKRLIEEIEELRQRVDQGRAPAGVQPDTVNAIDHVRHIGNIGADMEADINVIVDSILTKHSCSLS